MVLTRKKAYEADAPPPVLPKKGKKGKVTKVKKTRAPSSPKVASPAPAITEAPVVPDITVTRVSPGPRNARRSPSASAPESTSARPKTPPEVQAPPTPKPRYVPPKRRRSSQTKAERSRNAVLFYNKLLPLSRELADSFEDFDNEEEMFKVWHLLEEALAKLARASGHWSLDTVSPGVPLDEEGLPESPRGRRITKYRRA